MKLTQAMRSDIDFAGDVATGRTPATVEGGADIGSLCETIVALDAEVNALRADAALGAAVRHVSIITWQKVSALLERHDSGFSGQEIDALDAALAPLMEATGG